MYARVTTTQSQPDKADEAGRVIKDQVIPSAQQIAGFKGGLWLIDRASGKGLTVALYETQDALRASEAAAATIRQDAVNQLGADLVSVETYELVGSAGLAEAITDPA